MHGATPSRLAATWSRSSRLGKAAAIACVLVSAALLFGIPGLDSFIPYRIDLDVYRIGGQVLLDGGDLYGELPKTLIGVGLPFTYPPIAAVFFAPLALLPFWLANLLLTGLTLLSCYVVQRLLVRRLWPEHAPAGILAAALLVALVLGPTVETVSFGQVNAILMALVVVDAMVGKDRRWGGVLVGLAMAIKLTPAVFLAYFLVKRDWASLGRALLSAAAFTGIGFLVVPGASVQYWTQTLLDPSRIGGLAYVSNQSINGALTRLSPDGSPSRLVWFLLCAVIGLALLLLMRRLIVAGQDHLALILMGFYALVASPVSWAHHWVWIAPALLALTERYLTTRHLRHLVLAVSGLLIFVGRVIWWLPNSGDAELAWTWWQQLIGNAYLIWGLCFMAICSLAWRGDHRPAEGPSIGTWTSSSAPQPTKTSRRSSR